jgi:hypothetical protein
MDNSGASKTFICKGCGATVITTIKELIDSGLCSDCHKKKK